MKIYVTHSTSFDYNKELYLPIRESFLNEQHEIVLPHEESSEPFDSKKIFDECELVIAEVSYPSTGQGIELGWANLKNIPIKCFYKTGTKYSESIKVVSNKIIEYIDKDDLIKKISDNL